MDHSIFIMVQYIFLFLLLCNVCKSSDETSSKNNFQHKLTHLPDAQVIYPSLVDVDSYALTTVPLDTIYICQSSLPNAGLGAFAARPIPRLSYFGPYGGHKYTFDVPQKSRTYAWNIPDQSGNDMYYVDGSEPNKSNWLRYVNCPNIISQQNLMAFVHNDNIFYLVIRNITMGEELLVYYGKDYAKRLGVDTTQFP